MIGQLLCRVGRHEWEYLVTDDMAIRWCPRCQNPKAANAFDAKRIPGTGNAPAIANPEHVRDLPPDQPRPDLATDLFRTALALVKSVDRSDAEAIVALAPYGDALPLVIGLCHLTRDALAEPPSTDLVGYVDRLFTQADRSQQ
jgi:hypothetical protein